MIHHEENRVESTGYIMKKIKRKSTGYIMKKIERKST